MESVLYQVYANIALHLNFLSDLITAILNIVIPVGIFPDRPRWCVGLKLAKHL